MNYYLKNIKGYKNEKHMDALVDFRFAHDFDERDRQYGYWEDFVVIEIYAGGKLFDFDKLSPRHQAQIRKLCFSAATEQDARIMK